MSEKLQKKYCGKIGVNKHGSKMEIISYNKQSDIVVKFLDEHGVEVHTAYTNFRRGSVKNPYDKKICGVGYLGEGRYTTKILYPDGKYYQCPQYIVWNAMIKRCYFDNEKDLHPSYYHITTVCEEWKNFQVFARWYDDNFYDIGEGRMHLDKDILVPGNKVYSPETCIFVPQRINMMFMDISSKRIHDKDLPQGISRGYSADGNIRYRVMYGGKQVGTYDTLPEAYGRYIQAKKKAIVEVATEYRGKIPERLYNALMNWKSDEDMSAA